MDNLYAAEAPILQRLEARLKGPLKLREVYGEVDLPGVTSGSVHTPAVALTSYPFEVRDTSGQGAAVLSVRWQVVAIARAANDRGRADRARDEAGRIAVEIIRHLSGWPPATGFGRLALKQVLARRYVGGKVFVPLVFACTTDIEPAP